MSAADPPLPRRDAAAIPYQPAIDGLRAVSVLAVIAYHAGTAHLGGGFLGVEVFFAVSGYLITSLILAEHRATSTVALRAFWARRARRLLPALYVVLLAVIAATFLIATDSLGRLRGDVVAALTYTSNWWQVIHSDSYFVQAGRPPLLSHLWSLAVEEQFYLVWPVALAFVLRRRWGRVMRWGTLGLAVGSALWCAFLATPYADNTRVYVGTDTRMSGLMAGAALAMVWSPRRLRRAQPNPGAVKVLDAIGVVGFATLLGCFVWVNEFDPFIYRGGFVLVDVATVAVVAVVVHPAARLGRVLGWWPLQWIGRRSYGLYLWHWPVLQLTRPDLDLGWPTWTIVALRVVLVAALTEVSYRLVETPLRRGAFERWWRSVRRPPEGETGRRRLQVVAAGVVPVVVIGLLAIAPAQAATHQPRREADVTLDLSHAFGTATTSPSSTTTTAAPDASTTAATDPPIAPPTTPPPTTTPPAPLPPPPVQPLPAASSAIGDSVMAGAASTMRKSIPGIVVDARKSRQFNEAIGEIVGLDAAGLLAPVVVVHLGTNGPFSDAQLDKMVGAVGIRKIYVVTAKVPRPWEGIVNDRIRAGAARHPNMRVIDWNATSAGHPEYFYDDGTHLTPDGIRAYTLLMISALGQP